MQRQPFSSALPIPDALQTAHKRAGLSYRQVASALTDTYGIPTSRALIGRIIADGTGTNIDRAEALAVIYGTPITRIFTHPNGDPIGGGL